MGKQYFLTGAAEADLLDIFVYTLEEWGETQVHAYKRQLESRLEAILKFPDIGRKHPKLSTDVYHIVEGKHYIFYKKVDDGIEVLRFLHHCMDIISHLSDEL
ncbi:MAG: type II toxin-antitoxin system RelE/ParE family toxin [Lentisphaeraceae bacterium]|nr:type II toxin-antitoxin system RelE/ParE family toxin [Lentisphaeraceae bacterium]